MAEPSEDRPVPEGGQELDEDAAREIFDRYAEKLVNLARRRLSVRLASRVDPEDIVQSVFRTFFGRLRAGKFHIADQDDLFKLLVRITVHKTLRQVEFHGAAKRDPRRESPQASDSFSFVAELLDREPTPAEEIAFVDQVAHFLERLLPEERQIVELRIQGYSNQDIAKKLGIYDRKIRRVIERLRGLEQQERLLG